MLLLALLSLLSLLSPLSPPLSLPSENTMRRQPSASSEGGIHKNTSLLTS